jgi:hypothetical protein
MSLSTHIAKHFRDIHFGGNWTTVNLKDSVAGLGWQEAITPVFNCNSIATLVYHATYYVSVLVKVLEGGPLDAKDAYSFQLPPIQSQHDWEALLNKAWADAATAAQLIEQLPDSRLTDVFVDEKYGNYFRNITGTIEHLHYHLGQITIIRKIMQQTRQS